MIDIDKYLIMSRYNPEFKADYDYVLYQLAVARDNQEISHNKYMHYVDRMMAIKSGQLEEKISSSLIRFDTIKKKGFYNIHFNKEEMRSLLLARHTCAEFNKWVDLGRHRYNNPHIIKYLKELASKVLEGMRDPNEELWRNLDALRTNAVMSMVREITSRVHMVSIAEVLKAGMIYKLKVERSLPARDFKKMAIVDEVSEVNLDIEAIGINLMFLFLTNRYEFEDKAKSAHAALLEMFNNGQINRATYAKYNSALAEYTYYPMEIAKTRAFDPIIRYYWCISKGISLGECLVYTEKQIMKAMEFAREFYGTLRNDFLVYQMITRKLEVDLNRFDHSIEVKQKLWTSLMENLETLQEFGIISTTEYLDYRQMGREKYQ
jgi:hypothetical protein